MSSPAALAAALPSLTEEMHRINGLLAHGHRAQAIDRFFAVVAEAIRTQRTDVSSRGHLLAGRTVQIGVCRIPAEPRPGKPIAVFLPGVLSALPLTAVRALAFFDLFDIVLCDLPGHGATGELDEISIEAFASEYAALIAAALPNATGLTLIGESLGGLVALALAQLRPNQVKNVILIDTPFHLTRPDLAEWISDTWHTTGQRPYARRICREIMGFDPLYGHVERETSHHAMVRDAPFGCVHLVGGPQSPMGLPSAVTDTDIAALRAANPEILIPPRIPACGHAVLLDNPNGARAALEALIVPGA